MVTFIFERHGQSQANLDKVFAGSLDIPLTEYGVAQAKKTAEYVAENYKVDKIYASDLKRAFDTAKQLAELLNMDIIPNKNLREIYAGKWQGTTFDELSKREDYNVWINDIGNAQCDGGDSVREFSKRVVSEVKKIAEQNDGKTIFIATHATPIRAVRCYCENIPIEDMKKISWTPNCSVTVIEYDKGSWTLKLDGYDKHLGEMTSKFPANV